MHKFRKLKFAAILVMIFAIFASLLPTPVMADEDENDDSGTAFAEKILLNTFRLCYSSNYMAQGVADGGIGDLSYKDVTSVFKKIDSSEDPLKYEDARVYNFSDSLTKLDSIDDLTDELRRLSFGTEGTDSQCEAVYKMLNSKRPPKVDYISETDQDGSHRTRRSGSSTEDIDAFFFFFCYSENPDKDERQPVCAEISYKLRSDKVFYTYKTLSYLCWDDATIFSGENSEKKGIFSPDNFTLIDVAPDIGTVKLSKDNNGEEGNNGVFWIEGLGTVDSNEGHVNIKEAFRYDASDTAKPVKYDVCKQPKQGDGEVSDPETTCFFGPYYSYDDSGNQKNEYSVMMRIINDKSTARSLYDGSKYFYIDNWGDAFVAARGNLDRKYAGIDTMFLPFTWQEVFDFYAHYLVRVFGVVIDSVNCDQQASSDKIYTANGWCPYLTANDESSDSVVTVFSHNTGSAGANVVLNQTANLKGLLEKMYIIASRENVNGVALDDQGKLTDPMPLLSARRVSILDDRCYINGESLGWVLCPIIEFAHDAMESMYRDIVQGYLTIDTVLLTTTNPEGVNQSGTYQAWSIFVGFANVLMIIFLLVIISKRRYQKSLLRQCSLIFRLLFVSCSRICLTSLVILSRAS